MESLGVKTERGVELLALSQDPSMQATLRHSDGSSEQISPRWVIGCDGSHSRVREMTGVPFEGGGVGLSFFLGDCEIEGRDAAGDELSIHVRQGDLVFMGRLSERIVRVIVALHEQQNGFETSELALEDFQSAVDRVGVRVKIKSADWMTPFRVNDRQAKHYRIGNIFLAGDASHIHSPVGGQGMNTGIQDAANLAWKMAAVARGASDVLLDSYEEERGEVGKALLRFTERGLRLATISNPVLEWLRDTLAPVISILPPIQHTALGFISETGIQYRGSSIVADYGGDGHLRAGDRLPDLSLKDGHGRSTLLNGWTSPRHRIFALNLDSDDIGTMRAGVPGADVVALATANLDHEGRKLLGDDGKIFVLRPDGYLGFRSPMGFQVELMHYAAHNALV
jgi:hypothetical protein